MLIAIPVSLLIALIAMKVTGLTLNNISPIALTTAIGVLVDDSIVVLEDIHSHLERGEEPLEAAIEGQRHDVEPLVGARPNRAPVPEDATPGGRG